MQKGNFSATIVVNGTEHGAADGSVVLEFGDEYRIRLRTHNGRRGVARIWIDEVEITGGGVIIDKPEYGTNNYRVDLETPPASPGSRFRFASTESQAAHQAGKGGPDYDGSKGLIRIEFQSEKERAIKTSPVVRRRVQPHCFPTRGGDKISGRYEKTSGFMNLDAVVSGMSMDFQLHEEVSSGVTVAGSASSQQFFEEHIEVEGPVVTILLKLRGRSPSYVPYSTRYCSRCGCQDTLLSNVCQCGSRLR